MSPEYFPELLLLFAAVVLVGVAFQQLSARRVTRALQVGGISAACIALVFLSERYAHPHYKSNRPFPMKPLILVPKVRADSLKAGSEASRTFDLRLGGISVQVPDARKYVFSESGEEFLALDFQDSGLFVSCDVAGSYSLPIRAPTLAAHLSHNRVLSTAPGIRTFFPDANTILVQENGKSILRIHYASPHRVDVDGAFYFSKNTLVSPDRITFADGIRWAHGRVDPGLGVDLRPQGVGRIDFSNDGRIQVLPK